MFDTVSDIPEAVVETEPNGYSQRDTSGPSTHTNWVKININRVPRTDRTMGGGVRLVLIVVIVISSDNINLIINMLLDPMDIPQENAIVFQCSRF